MEIGVKQAKIDLSKLIERVRRGESVTITNHGEPVAALIAVRTSPKRRDKGYGRLRERLRDLPPDWDSPAEKARTNALLLGEVE